MAFVTLYANKSVSVSESAPDTNFSTETEWENPPHREIFFKFESIPNEYKYRKLEGFSVTTWAKKTALDSTSISAWFYLIETAWDEATVTYNNRPVARELLPGAQGQVIYNQYSQVNTSTGWGSYSESKIIAITKQTLNNGISILVRPSNGQSMWASSRNQDNKPWLSLYVSDTDAVPSSTQSPTSGYINKSVANTFTATFIPSTLSFAQLERTTLYIDWKESETGTVTTVNCGNADSYTFPANTFTGDTVIWRARMLCSNGTTYEWPWRTLTTIEPLMTAQPVSPINVIADGGEEITFQWTTASSAGVAPTGADLQISEDGVSWTDLGHVSGAETVFTAAPDSLPPGNVSWRVRAINGSGVAGAWSDSAVFVNVSAPPQPSLSVDAVPFATLNWQASGQQAYRIIIDGKDYGSYFGTAKSFTLTSPLEDGQHTAELSVQGIYGLWSRPAVYTFTIQNAGAGEIVLSGEFGVDAALSWTGTETGTGQNTFLVFRDGTQIASIQQTTYTDRTILGEHSYQILLRLDDGNYIRSNAVTGTCVVDAVYIALLSGGNWLQLRLSESSATQQVFRYSRSMEMRHITGAKYPVLEMSPYEDEIGEYDAAFVTAEDAKPLLDMRGQVVILKSRGDRVVIGPMAEIETVHGDFYVSCRFSIQQIHWEGFSNA